MILKGRKGGVTSTIALMLVIMLSINIALAFVQTGINDLNSNSNQFYDSDTPYSQHITGDLLTGDVALGSEFLPEDEATTGGTGNIITDTYTGAKSWLKTTLQPLGFISNLFSQPKGLLLSAGMPHSVALAVQVLWNGLILIFFTAFLFGRT